MQQTYNLNYLIQHLAAVINKQADQVLQEQLGIGISQYRILAVLDVSPKIEQLSIAKALGQTEASISRQIKLLQAKGLLLTKIDPENRRKHITLPTTLGLQITDAATVIMNRNFSPDIDEFGKDKATPLLAELVRLHQITCQPGKLGACDHVLGF
jgi:DNA-binding MarR family transcriptional regulator